MQKRLRRAQTITPFGVGAVVDIMGESLVAADILRWERAGERIQEPRLERRLGVSHFRMAPPAPDNPWQHVPDDRRVPYFRFPQWLFCRRCRWMYRVSVYRETGEAPVCTRCDGNVALTPMRFVMACPRGHLADVPWERWAHQDRVGKCEAPDLKFETLPGGSGLQYVRVLCVKCGARRSLAGIAARDSLRRLGIRCTGRQPWQRSGETCDAVPQVLQRGATNLTFAVIESSIDIPPHSRYSRYADDRLLVIHSELFPAIKSAPTGPFVPSLINMIATKTGVDARRVSEIIDAELQDGSGARHGGAAARLDEDLLGPEYEALMGSDEDYHPGDRFIKRRVVLESYLEGLSDSAHARAARNLAERLARVVQVTRLREVRALVGFSRLGPSVGTLAEDEEPGAFSVYGSEQRIRPELTPVDLGQLVPRDRWLPAIEVYGEGIFVSLDERVVQAWEVSNKVRERVRVIADRRDRHAWFLTVPTPRLVMLHTLAHVMIRQLSFECGYSIASLRERIYARELGEGTPMAGILIYTAAGDSEGTLGGLVREGDADRFLSSVIEGLLGAEWCSSDPICRESTGQGPGALNLAACHACALLPETSCTMYNRLLDRVLLVGGIENASMGLFGDLVVQSRQSIG